MNSKEVQEYTDAILEKSDNIEARIKELYLHLSSYDNNVDEVIGTIKKRKKLNKSINDLTASIKTHTEIFNTTLDSVVANKTYLDLETLKKCKHDAEIELRKLNNTKKTTPDIRAIKKEINRLKKERRITLNTICEKVYEFMNEEL
jgi:flagellar biosynthesis regulator FlbT